MPEFLLFNVLSSTLESHSLDAAPPYLAISHVWSEHLLPLKLNPLELSYSIGLRAAREAITRRHPTVQHLWFDTLCIRQYDEQHKIEQIPLMGRVYTQCAAVVVVLGGVTLDWSQTEVDELAAFFEPMLLSDETKSGEIFEQKWWQGGERRQKMARYIDMMRPLWWSEWATRVWTLQEFVLPPEVIWIGMDYKPVVLSDIFFRFVPALGIATSAAKVGVERLSAALARFKVTSDMRDERGCGLMANMTRIVHVGGRCAATNPVDQLYGIMGAAGVTIKPKPDEDLDGAWVRWWEAAVGLGFVRWIAMDVLPCFENGPVALQKREREKFNCVMPSTSQRAYLSNRSNVKDHRALGAISVNDGVVSLQGRRVGSCKIVANLNRVIIDRSLATAKGFSDALLCLFTNNDMDLAMGITIGLTNSASDIDPTAQHIEDFAALLCANYNNAIQQIENEYRGFEWKFTSETQKEALQAFQKRGMLWGGAQSVFGTYLYLAEVEVPALEWQTVVFVYAGQDPRGELFLLDVNARNRDGIRTCLVVGPGELYSSTPNASLHKFGTAPLFLGLAPDDETYGLSDEPQAESQWDRIPIENFAIGGTSCPVCLNYRQDSNIDST